MAAVALLGILYAYLAKAASQGILTAGESRWRLEASLLADEELASLERQLREGAPLEVGSLEAERDPFVVTVEIEPFTLTLPEVAPTDQPPDLSAASLLGSSDDPQDTGILRQVTIRVSWFDGVEEQQIERITFGYDASAALPLLGADLIAGPDSP